MEAHITARGALQLYIQSCEGGCGGWQCTVCLLHCGHVIVGEHTPLEFRNNEDTSQEVLNIHYELYRPLIECYHFVLQWVAGSCV